MKAEDKQPSPYLRRAAANTHPTRETYHAASTAPLSRRQRQLHRSHRQPSLLRRTLSSMVRKAHSLKPTHQHRSVETTKTARAQTRQLPVPGSRARLHWPRHPSRSHSQCRSGRRRTRPRKLPRDMRALQRPQGTAREHSSPQAVVTTATPPMATTPPPATFFSRSCPANFCLYASRKSLRTVHFDRIGRKPVVR